MDFSEDVGDSQVSFSISILFANSSCLVECEILYCGHTELFLW